MNKYIVKTEFSPVGVTVEADSFYCVHPREYTFIKTVAYTTATGEIGTISKYVAAFTGVLEIKNVA